MTPSDPSGLATAMLSEGTVLLGRFRCDRQIGATANSSVWRAFDQRLQRDVVVKVLSADMFADPEHRERFEREAAAAARLAHPNVVRLYDLFVSDDGGYLVYGLVEGPTLREILAERGPLPVETTAAIGVQITNGLAGLHGIGFVHRDLRPDGVVINDHGRVILVDLGLVKTLGALATTTLSLDSPLRYLAPEQIVNGTVDTRTDLYCLGLLLWSCLAGEEPFDEHDLADALQDGLEREVPSIRERRPDVPAEIADLLERTTASDPSRRPSEATEILDALSRLAGPRPEALTLELFEDHRSR